MFLCRYAAGDVVMMYPQNSPEDVEQFCQLLRLDLEAIFTLEPTYSTAGTEMFIESNKINKVLYNILRGEL